MILLFQDGCWQGLRVTTAGLSSLSKKETQSLWTATSERFMQGRSGIRKSKALLRLRSEGNPASSRASSRTKASLGGGPRVLLVPCSSLKQLSAVVKHDTTPEFECILLSECLLHAPSSKVLPEISHLSPSLTR